ncbi:MAG: helix-turn-helix transcriptional regulator [Spirochaetales bacterium]|nr:helix-turn-helix transcriptional regulator [Spirochaetales bacterium]
MPDTALLNKLRIFRSQVGLTQEEMAQKTGVTRQTIISIEKGNYTPSVQLALRLAKVLGITVEELFYEEGE